METEESIETRICLSVEIPVAGDGFPSARDLKARNAITDRLDRRGIGKFVGAGGGMGAMDFAYVVTDDVRARQEIAAAIAAILPGSPFTIDESSADDVEIDDEDDDEEGSGSINWPLLVGLAIVVGAILGGLVWLVWSIVT